MGLDSVELILEFEKYFEIKISDAEAGEIGTVKDAVDCISSHTKFADRSVDLKKDILNLLTETLLQLNAIKTPLLLDQKLFSIIPFENQDLWKEVSENISCELPAPTLTGKFGKLVEKIFPSKIDFSNTTVDRFIDLVGVVNYKDMLIQGQMQNQYEVLLGVMGITMDKCGVNPYEMFPDKSFVNDFGIN